MAESKERIAKRKMLQERYGINFAPPKNKGGRPKGSKNKKKSDKNTITTKDYKGEDASEV